MASFRVRVQTLWRLFQGVTLQRVVPVPVRLVRGWAFLY